MVLDNKLANFGSWKLSICKFKQFKRLFNSIVWHAYGKSRTFYNIWYFN